MEPTIRINGEVIALTVGTLAELVADRSGAPDGRGVAVALNGAVVRRPQWAETRLNPGDVVEIVQARQGG